MQQVYGKVCVKRCVPPSSKSPSIPVMSCASTRCFLRLQTGMRCAFRKVPRDFCCPFDANGNHAREALRRAKFKFPGRQKYYCQSQMGLHKVQQNRLSYLKWKQENRIEPDGVNAKLLGCHGPLAVRRPGKAFVSEALNSAA